MSVTSGVFRGGSCRCRGPDGEPRRTSRVRAPSSEQASVIPTTKAAPLNSPSSRRSSRRSPERPLSPMSFTDEGPNPVARRFFMVMQLRFLIGRSVASSCVATCARPVIASDAGFEFGDDRGASAAPSFEVRGLDPTPPSLRAMAEFRVEVDARRLAPRAHQGLQFLP